MTCELSHLDGAYVLGSLSPGERQQFERHLATCDECSRSVRELAGLPGLLARVDPSVLEGRDEGPPLPETLLPSLVAAVSRDRRRRFLVTAGLAAAAVVAAVTVPLAATGVLAGDHQPTGSSSTQAAHVAQLRMTPIGGAPVRAEVALQPVAWGTRLDLTCTYSPTAKQYQLPHVATYVLVVRTRDGRTEQVGTWKARDGETMRLSGATSASRNEIASVEVRTAKGQAVLRLTA